MKVVIRSDASVEIGTGHIMRCLALATQFKELGAQVRFICVDTPGHLGEQIVDAGMELTLLNVTDALVGSIARQAVARSGVVDLLVVDHYGLDGVWEDGMRDVAKRIMVIDDLGRAHSCHFLLDQNLPNPAHDLYSRRTPSDCEIVLGPQYALLRPEFATLRPTSLSRSRRNLTRLLVFMGGSDPGNETTKVLAGIRSADIDCDVDVVIGASNPHSCEVRSTCAQVPYATLHLQTPRMAELMAAADCAIGAPGSATWERCSLGLPAVVSILADNQVAIAQAVAAAGGHQLLGYCSCLGAGDYAYALRALNADKLSGMARMAAAICDGRGATRVITRLVRSLL